jgi:predicted phage terminase large subunit-like protein
MSPTRAVLLALARKDFRTFLTLAFSVVRPGNNLDPAPYIDALAHELTRFANGDYKQDLVNMPPRHLKSFCCSVALVAWMMGQAPSLRFVCVSYSNELSKAHANDFRTLVTSPLYRQIFPGARFGASKNKNTELEIHTADRGYRLATSLEGTLTGRGGDVLIIDDPMKPEDAGSKIAVERVTNWYASTAVTRLDDKVNGRTLVVMQRLSADDLSGYLLRTDKRWHHVCYPAIAEERQVIDTGATEPWTREIGDVLHPVREPLSVLESLRDTMGPTQFKAQYQQEPVPLVGNMIQRAWFETYGVTPQEQYGDLIVQSWDTSYGGNIQSDYSVCVTALRRGRIYYILDVHRARLRFGELKKAVEARSTIFNPKFVLIENTVSGIDLISVLKDGTGLQPIPVKPEGDKEQRVFRIQGVLEGGYVRLPSHAPWLEEFLNELVSFPEGRFDDQVDALSQLIGWAEKRRITNADIAFGMPISVGDDRLSIPSFVPPGAFPYNRS